MDSKRKSLRARTLLFVAIGAYVLAWLTGWGESIVSGALATIGLIALLLAIVRFIVEARDRRKAKAARPTQP